MAILVTRETLKKELSCCYNLFSHGLHENALKKANQVGFKTFEILKNEENLNLKLLIFMDFKESVLLTIDCVKKRNCVSCATKHLKSVITLLQKMSDDDCFPFELRQKIGCFLNEIKIHHIDEKHAIYFTQKEIKRRHHLKLVK